MIQNITLLKRVHSNNNRSSFSYKVMSHFYFLVDVHMQLYGLLGATLKICSMHAENYILANQGEKCCIMRVTDSDTDCKKCQPKSKKKKKLDSL